MRQFRCCAIPVAVLALHAPASAAGQWKFSLGPFLSVGGFRAADSVSAAHKVSAGGSADLVMQVPGGYVLMPYYEFDSGFALGASAGPQTGVWNDGAYVSHITPVGFDLRQRLLRRDAFQLYAKAGWRYLIATGDDVGSSGAGAYGAIGIELPRGTVSRKLLLGIELGYGTTRLDVHATGYGMPGLGSTPVYRDTIRVPGLTAGFTITF